MTSRREREGGARVGLPLAVRAWSAAMAVGLAGLLHGSPVAAWEVGEPRDVREARGLRQARDAAQAVVTRTRPPLRGTFEFRAGGLHAQGDDLLADGAPGHGIGFRAGAAAGVEIARWFQLLFAIDLADPQLHEGAARTIGVPGRYDSGTIALGLDARLVSPPFLGLQWLGGFGLRAKLMSISYDNPNATSPPPTPTHRISGRDRPPSDVSQHYLGLGYGPILGARRTLFGEAGREQIAVIVIAQPEWSRWWRGGNDVRRDDALARAVGQELDLRARDGGSFSWSASGGIVLVF